MVPAVPPASQGRRGRRLLPSARPGTAAERFAWLVRAIRAYHGDADLTDTARFTARLNDHLRVPLREGTVGKLENGQVEFTFERCAAYERVLGLTEDSLLDAYIYQFRSAGLTPKADPHGPVTAHDLELVVRIAQQNPLTPREWLEAASFLAGHRELFPAGPALDVFMFGLLEATRDAFEHDLRLLREALIVVGTPAVPYIVELVDTEPIRYFNNIEVLGYLDDRTALDALAALGRNLDDSVLAQTTLEALQRIVHRTSLTLPDLAEPGRAIQRYCAEVLSDPDSAYTAREEALGLLSLPHAEVPRRRRATLVELRDDLNQLRIRPRFSTRDDIVRAVFDQNRDLLKESGTLPGGMPAAVPGLETILSHSLFGHTRIDRLNGAVLLSSFPFAGVLSRALGDVLLNRVHPQDYGLQRAMLRLMTKAGNGQASGYFTTFAMGGIVDDNTRLTVAWALGGGNKANDETALRHLYQVSSTSVTKRVIVNSAARRGFRSLLELAAAARDSRVAAEARRALSRDPH